MRCGRCSQASGRSSSPPVSTASTVNFSPAVRTRRYSPASTGPSGKFRRSSDMSPSTVSRADSRLGIYYEHPDWYRPLFDVLDERGVAYDKLHADTHRFDPSEQESPYAVVFNRMSPSAYNRGRGHLIFYTQQYLSHLERLGVRAAHRL